MFTWRGIRTKLQCWNDLRQTHADALPDGKVEEELLVCEEVIEAVARARAEIASGLMKIVRKSDNMAFKE